MAEGRVVKVAKAPKPAGSAAQGSDAARILARLCYYYPQYTLQQARSLPYKHVVLMLKTVERERASYYHNLTQIVAAPHTKGGDLYKQLKDRYGELADG